MAFRYRADCARVLLVENVILGLAEKLYFRLR